MRSDPAAEEVVDVIESEAEACIPGKTAGTAAKKAFASLLVGLAALSD